jgi:methylated-DNA-[protein]-cysteine S-methyltransferase
VNFISLNSPIGRINISADDEYITGLAIGSVPTQLVNNIQSSKSMALLKTAEKNLRGYLSGVRKELDLPYKAEGTSFQKKVWTEVAKVPFGETVSYKQIAVKIGMPKAVRAVANAVASNPIAIIVPCHRIIGSDGKLRGYAYGLECKRKLLELEKILK